MTCLRVGKVYRIAWTIYHVCNILTLSLISKESHEPRKLHRAARRACLLSFFCRRSPRNAPTSGHTINHTGGKRKNQIIVPMVDHRTHALLHPYFFVPKIGRK